LWIAHVVECLRDVNTVSTFHMREIRQLDVYRFKRSSAISLAADDMIVEMRVTYDALE
jgi:hypothetical protein